MKRMHGILRSATCRVWVPKRYIHIMLHIHGVLCSMKCRTSFLESCIHTILHMHNVLCAECHVPGDVPVVPIRIRRHRLHENLAEAPQLVEWPHRGHEQDADNRPAHQAHAERVHDRSGTDACIGQGTVHTLCNMAPSSDFICREKQSAHRYHIVPERGSHRLACNQADVHGSFTWTQTAACSRLWSGHVMYSRM